MFFIVERVDQEILIAPLSSWSFVCKTHKSSEPPAVFRLPRFDG